MTYRYETYKVLKELTPWDITEHKKIRVGSSNDGGYVLIDNFSKCKYVLSFGAGHDISFDKYFSSKGVKVFLFDPYVDNIAIDDNNIMFLRIGLKALASNDVISYNLSQILDIFDLRSKNDLILKLDIEGDEWDIIDQTDSKDLEYFSQIVVEIHWLNNLSDREYSERARRVFAKINENFTLFHVHGNNCASLSNINGFPVPDVLELSYIRTKDVKRTKSVTMYPTVYDSANDKSKPDHLLWFFPFLPSISCDKKIDHNMLDVSFKSPILKYNKFKKININHGKKPTILYTSCHEILEYDELRMLKDLGYSVFSTGSFSGPDHNQEFRHSNGVFYNHDIYLKYSEAGHQLTTEFLSLFDVAIVMHEVDVVARILSERSSLPLIYRSIGQSNLNTESILNDYKDRVIVTRYSEKECGINGFVEEDAVIYFGKYPDDFKNWTGGDKMLTFHNNYINRSSMCCPDVDFYKKICELFSSNIGGIGNMDLPNSIGNVDSNKQMDFYRNCSLYFLIHSLPPSYTLSFIEALGVGTPIMAPSESFLEDSFSKEYRDQIGFPISRYEIDDLLSNDSALLYDSFDDAVGKIRWLLDNPRYAEDISAKNRIKFHEYFDAKKISRQWDNLIMSL